MEIAIEYQPIVDRFQQSAPVDVTGLAEALGLAVWEDEDLQEGVPARFISIPRTAALPGTA